MYAYVCTNMQVQPAESGFVVCVYGCRAEHSVLENHHPWERLPPPLPALTRILEAPSLPDCAVRRQSPPWVCQPLQKSLWVIPISHLPPSPLVADSRSCSDVCLSST